ncbi:MAG: hypothetical protein R3182_03450 [Draconibacterium sp.]|nr:hypothetical protein [Draconibacterium sp.]
MHKILLLLICFCGFTVAGQDTIYLNSKKQKVKKSEASFYKIQSSNSTSYNESTYLINGILKIETIYQTDKKKKRIKHSVWYDSGRPHIVRNYKNGKQDGEFISLWEKGGLKRKDIYKKGKWISGTCWNEKGEEVPYYEFEQHPQFPGGSKAFNTYLKNTLNIGKQLNTRAVVEFFINSKGVVTDPKLIQRTNDLRLDQYIINTIFNMPNWEPARQDGNSVGVWRSVAINL